MMKRTDRHDRFFLRQISRHVRLYTEMITSQALLHGDRARLLDFDRQEHPLALQIGGSDPADMAACAVIAEDRGYDEVNINVGCPSDRVQSGRFGACLMLEAGRVGECVDAMRSRVDIPVTVKCRIGVDNQDPYTALPSFVEQVAASGCQVFIIHARKAWLSGLSPAQNRTVPPLDHALVDQLKTARPDLTIVINGGLTSIDDARTHADRVDGAMIGRAAYERPWILADADRYLFDDDRPAPNRRDVIEAMADYAARQGRHGVPLKSITRHMVGLFHGQPGARTWRRMLSEQAIRPDATYRLLHRVASRIDGPERAAA